MKRRGGALCVPRSTGNDTRAIEGIDRKLLENESSSFGLFPNDGPVSEQWADWPQRSGRESWAVTNGNVAVVTDGHDIQEELELNLSNAL
ncbi:hypothetical protein SKAU_G00230220 [Synaphobranchus kaupii]|uniref:Uncharacterized protein n=1 Tax=Synaphobranchus kaupii TaxID=118154 RepID=A0A9Q1F5X7_SYNKA|nr:hypothetical protein SKAU_G00230220 [Synaphobranchus kaupii]